MTTPPTVATPPTAADLLTADLAAATKERDQADAKANHNLSAVVAVTLGFAALVAGIDKLGTASVTLVSVSIGLLVAAGVALGAATRPALPRSNQWGFVHAAANPPADLVVAYRQLAVDEAGRDLLLATALHHQSVRVARKYRLVRVGQILAAVGLPVGLAGLMLAAFT